jgi:hypothetical protein
VTTEKRQGLTGGRQRATTVQNKYSGGVADLAEGSGLCRRSHGSMHACELPVDDVADTDVAPTMIVFRRAASKKEVKSGSLERGREIGIERKREREDGGALGELGLAFSQRHRRELELALLGASRRGRAISLWVWLDR